MHSKAGQKLIFPCV